MTKCVIEDGSENFVKLAEIYSLRSLLLRKLQYLESPISEQSAPPTIISEEDAAYSTQCNSRLPNVMSIRNIKFRLFKFRDDNYSFFTSYEILVYKNVRQQLNKLAAFKFHFTIHRFHARVQSSTCTTCGKYLQEIIMAVLTPKLVIKE